MSRGDNCVPKVVAGIRLKCASSSEALSQLSELGNRFENEEKNHLLTFDHNLLPLTFMT